MTDADGNVVVTDQDGKILARAHPGRNGETVLTDAEGNPLADPTLNVQFDANGEPIFQPEVVDTLAVDKRYIDIVAQGMEMVNNRMSDTEYFTGATYVDWEEMAAQGVNTAGKTGTAEYCDNIAIKRGWCRFEDIAQRRILPTHSWYVGYAPYDDPQIVVSVFIFNGGEGSQWAAPVACHVMAAYFGLGQYASLTGDLTSEEAAELPTVCDSTVFNPELPQLDPAAAEGAEGEAAVPEDAAAPVEPPGE
jgi:penicillin-binding protein 2